MDGSRGISTHRLSFREHAVGHHGAVLQNGQAGHLIEQHAIGLCPADMGCFPEIIPDLAQNIPFLKPVSWLESRIPAAAERGVFIDGILEHNLLLCG